MEFNELRSAWNNIDMRSKSMEDIRLMLIENNHPVLKRVRIQLAVESIIWTAFLLVYYSMFNGGDKPVGINMILIGSVLLSIMHNLMGQRYSKYLVTEGTLKESLEAFLSRFKRYAVVSILSRVLLMIGLILFFFYGLPFNSARYFFFLMIVLTFSFQVFLLYKLWSKRWRYLAAIIQSLTGQ